MCIQALWALLFSGLCFLSRTESLHAEYHFVNKNVTWSEAQQFCRQHYSDLATVVNNTDILPRPTGYSGPVWIGLFDDPSDLSTWRWSATGASPSYSNWSQNQPLYMHSSQHCVLLSNTGWYSLLCVDRNRVLCFSDSNPKKFHLINTTMSWMTARDYCRKYHTDLAVITSANDNVPVPADGEGVWIGLYRDSWRWSDNTPVIWKKWQNVNLERYPSQRYCAVEVSDLSWKMFPCPQKYPFYCQGKLKLQNQIVTIQLSGLDLSDPNIYQQLLEKMGEKFKGSGHANVRIKWKIPPQKITGEEENTGKKATNLQQCKYTDIDD